MSSRTLIAVVVGLVAVCACALAVVVLSGGFYLYQEASVEPATPVAGATPVAQTMEAIQAYVIVTRGLQPEHPVERVFLTTAEVRERVLADFEEDTSPEEMADDARVLAAFGLTEPGLDLYDLFVRLYTEGVAGFYDPDTGELVVVSDSEGFDVYEQTTFAHEYTHALQDQVFGIRESGFDDELYETDPERFNAIQAVLEGDATLLDEQYQETLSAAEKRAYEQAIDAIDVSIYYELPEFLLYDFFFPYEHGLAFVRRYYEAGGWARVDELWQDPPASTEHILHPDRYEAGDLPVPVARPALTDTLGSGWRLLDASVNGEWDTYLILAHGVNSDAQVSQADARRAAEGWGGDGYSVYYNDDTGEIVLAAHWVWDTEADAGEFAETFAEYAEGRFGPGSPATNATCWSRTEGPTCLYTGGTSTLWLMAPDQAALEAVLSQYAEFEPVP